MNEFVWLISISGLLSVFVFINILREEAEAWIQLYPKTSDNTWHWAASWYYGIVSIYILPRSFKTHIKFSWKPLCSEDWFVKRTWASGFKLIGRLDSQSSLKT
jgi:hypothetical protein